MKINKEIKSKLVNKNGFPKPRKVKCFQCETNFLVKFVPAKQNYSKKNNWEYWTGEKGDKEICPNCLKKLYYNKKFIEKPLKI